MTLKHGDEVILKSFGDEPEQRGEVQGEPQNGVVVVSLYFDYYDETEDDGLREVPVEQLKFVRSR